jgi:hypothetical protein
MSCRTRVPAYSFSLSTTRAPKRAVSCSMHVKTVLLQSTGGGEPIDGNTYVQCRALRGQGREMGLY